MKKRTGCSHGTITYIPARPHTRAPRACNAHVRVPTTQHRKYKRQLRQRHALLSRRQTAEKKTRTGRDRSLAPRCSAQVCAKGTARLLCPTGAKKGRPRPSIGMQKQVNPLRKRLGRAGTTRMSSTFERGMMHCDVMLVQDILTPWRPSTRADLGCCGLAWDLGPLMQGQRQGPTLSNRFPTFEGSND